MSSPIYVPLDQLMDLLGLQATMRLLERFGGRNLYVPKLQKLRAAHPIVEAIGIEAARKFVAEWQSLDVALPRAARELRERRDRAIREAAKHISISALAAQYQMTMRNVYRIVATADRL